MNATKLRRAREIKFKFFCRLFDMPTFLKTKHLLTRESPELKQFVKVGLRLTTTEKLGFGVPLTTRGPDKGKPDPIRYANKVLELHGWELHFVRREMNDRVVTNYYQLREIPIDHDYFDLDN